MIGRIAWSPDGRMLASKSIDDTARIWDAETGEALSTFDTEGTDSLLALSVAWSPDGKILAVPSAREVKLYDVSDDSLLGEQKLKNITINLAWSPGGRIIASSHDSYVRLWDVKANEFQNIDLKGYLLGLAWSPDGQTLAIGSMEVIQLWSEQTVAKVTLKGHSNWVNTLAWSPDGRILASGSWDDTVIIWDAKSFEKTNILEGHASWITSVSFSADGRLLASKSCDNTVKLWRCDTWDLVAEIPEPAENTQFFPGIAFHPKRPVLATLGENDRLIRIWEIDVATLLKEARVPEIVKYTSAKVVLIGESNVGKSCLAMRLAEDRYPRDEEHGSTHGMRFWPMQPEQLSPRAVAPAGQRRDVVLWDLGGQEEYRLVHQLFLHDTTLALVLLDPRRGQTAFDEVEAWNKRLDKQLGSRRAVKLLVGAKLDEPSEMVDAAALERLREGCGFAVYVETSAMNGRGVAELREAIAGALDWDSLAKTSRPELFQRIRDEIDRRKGAGEVVLLHGDLEQSVREANPDAFDPAAVTAVAEQLATQGVIAYTTLASGERVLVLKVEEIERYAGSLILAARANARGVPALEEKQVAAPDVPLPGIKAQDRLPRLQERVVLECVVQLLVEHGVCFRHEGLLIFPSLFRPTEKGTRGEMPHSVSLYYDFSGAVDNIYASLVAWLVIGKDFGRVRLWEDRAEFEAAGRGACGVRKVERGRGFAHIDVYFEEQTPHPTRELFISFVEDHLRRHDVEITEHIEMSCPACGYQFAEGDIRERIARGESDIGCVKCDHRAGLAAGATKARQLDPALERRTVALRTKVEEKVKLAAAAVKQFFRQTDEELRTDEPLRVLHLSDLHFGEGEDVTEKLRPLVADIKDKDGGLGFERLDYLVISGDITNRATPREFETAQRFTSGLIEAFELTAQRCVVVPGNHDLSWDEEVYKWLPKRKVSPGDLKAGQFRELSEGYLLRDAEHYPQRFANFSRFFYHPLFQLEYPMAFAEQGIPYLFADTGIQFLAFNSCWEIDEHFQERASVHAGALTRALEKADAQVAGQMEKAAHALRIAVWHHPITGNEKIADDSFMQQLRQANVRLVLHGHVHEDRADLVGYLHPKKVRVAGAGSFGARVRQRPESTPRLYNLLEITRDHASIKVHTRCLRKEGGAWEGWNVWPGPEPTLKSSAYSIELS
jgi:small GTP-binding protein